eukprot:gene9421-1628_t
MSENVEKAFSAELFSVDKLDALKQQFQDMKTNVGVSVHDLSLKHSVMIFFIKWYGCPICQEVIAELGCLLPPMLKLNTIPVIVHQGEENVALKYMSKCKDKYVSNLLYARTNKTTQELLGIGSVSLMKHVTAMMKMDVISAIKDAKEVEENIKEAEELKEQHDTFSDIFDKVIDDVCNNCISDTFCRFLKSKYRLEYDQIKNSNNQTINYFI